MIYNFEPIHITRVDRSEITTINCKWYWIFSCPPKLRGVVYKTVLAMGTEMLFIVVAGFVLEVGFVWYLQTRDMKYLLELCSGKRYALRAKSLAAICHIYTCCQHSNRYLIGWPFFLCKGPIQIQRQLSISRQMVASPFYFPILLWERDPGKKEMLQMLFHCGLVKRQVWLSIQHTIVSQISVDVSPRFSHR